ncbi:HEAT repeat domain-containing protein [Mesobacillus zeae]|uniref:HEAT repeat domain-containing protein n=1 Tax=Mesobacillus zeae TaxID=1917180 RepID=A0A398B450_9BACI|nr:HEAT repeat domain-containing protein [Mesobacillus zeae]RID84685.1 HEAT repeat domain-containing protein [Mesobacillus zeae]
MVGNEIVFLGGLAAFLLSVLLLLLLYLVVRKAVENRRRARIEKYKGSIEPILFQYVMDGNLPNGLDLKTNDGRAASEELLVHYSGILEGEEEKANISSFAELYLASHYREKLRDRKWSQRLNALYHIEDFHLSGLEDDILEYLRRRKLTRDEQVQCLNILASLQYADLSELLMTHYSNFSCLEYRNMFSRLDQSLFAKFVENFLVFPNEVQLAILDIISFRKEISYLGFCENIFEASRGEARLRALKAVASIGYVSSSENYLPLLQSADWQERMLAARLIGILQEQKGLNQLTDLLHDRVWWVRSQAGQSIMMFREGASVLSRVMEETDDAFARDMAWECLNRRLFNYG